MSETIEALPAIGLPIVLLVFSWLGLWKQVGLTAIQATQVCLQLGLGIGIPTAILILLYKDPPDIPSFTVRAKDDYYVAWCGIVGTMCVLSWLSYFQLAFLHLRAEVRSELGRNVRQRTMLLCLMFPLQVTLNSAALFGDLDVTGMALFTTAMDIMTLYLLLRMFLGYAGGFGRAHQAFSGLEEAPYLARMPLTGGWGSCQPRIKFDKGLIRYLKKNMLLVLFLVVVTMIIHAIGGQRGQGAHAGAGAVAAKLAIIWAMHNLLTLLMPITKQIALLRPWGKLGIVKAGIAISTLQDTLLSAFAPAIGGHGQLNDHQFALMLNAFVTSVEFGLISILLVPLLFKVKDYDYVLVWDDTESKQRKIGMCDSVAVTVHEHVQQNSFVPSSDEENRMAEQRRAAKAAVLQDELASGNPSNMNSESSTCTQSPDPQGPKSLEQALLP